MKISIIGGGSYLWTFGFVRQFIQSEYLAGAEVMLMDIDPSALDLVGDAARLYNRSHGSRLRIESATSLDRALEGAQFVLVSISTGGLAAMRHDLEIPERYGIRHTVGDTIGPGGWSRAARNIPVFDDLGLRMKRLCPDGWLINVTNPLTVLTRAPQRNHGIRAVGMCPGVENHARMLATLAGAKKGCQPDYIVTGIDHGSWFTQLHADGMDVLGRLKELGYYRSDDRLPSQVETNDPFMAFTANRAVFAMWREIGYMPSISDRHAVENWPWFLANGEEKLPFGIKRTSVAERERHNEERRQRLIAFLKTSDEGALGDMGHGNDPVGEVIESLRGHRSFLWGSNYMNVGQIPGFPDGAVVETRCRFDAAGVHPQSSPMPDLLKSIVLPHLCRQEAMIDIALRGSFDELVALVVTDPLCCRLRVGQCREMMRELMTANAHLIPNKRLLEF